MVEPTHVYHSLFFTIIIFFLVAKAEREKQGNDSYC